MAEIVVVSLTELIQIQLRLTLITPYSTPEKLIAAFRTNIAGLFVLNPFFRTDFPPMWNRS